MRTYLEGRAWAFAVTALASSLVLPSSGCSQKDSPVRLNGGGSTFVGPLMKKWATLYHDKAGIEVDYALKGSGNGIQQMTAKTYHFGCTDAPMNEGELKAAKESGGEVLHIPLVFGAVVPIYNLPELRDAKEPLNFTGPILADIYMGKITKWNDEALQKANPGVPLPDRSIIVVRRADPSGTSYIWTSFLATVSPPWGEKFGPGAKDVKWWEGTVGEQGNQGVAGHVSGSEGTIGYVELDYAVSNKLRFGAVQNKAGKSVQATSEAVTAAAKAAEPNIPDNLCFSLNYQDGEKAYPICGTVWAVLYQSQKAATGKAVVEFLTWCCHDGQKYASELNYAPLSDGLVQKIDDKLKSVKFAQ